MVWGNRALATPPRVLILGGTGVFGTLLARELLDTTDVRLTIAGRNPRRIRRTCRRLNAGHRVDGVHVDLSNTTDLRRAAQGCAVVMCTAGPFQSLSPSIVSAALDAGAHWIDIADDHHWISSLLADTALAAKADASELCVMPGASTIPAVSGALLGLCRDLLPAAVDAEVVLYIGNRNRKGEAVIASAMGSSMSSSADLVAIADVGTKGAYEISPSATVAAGIQVRSFVAPELGIGGALLAAASRTSGRRRQSIVRLLAVAAPVVSGWGTHRGIIQVTLHQRTAACTASMSGGQRLAVVPAVFALQLLAGPTVAGVVDPASLGATALLEFLAARGFPVTQKRPPATATEGRRRCRD